MARKAEVIITCDATTVKQVLEGLNREMEKTKQRREELQKKQAEGTKLTHKEERELEKLIKYENALDEKIPKIEGDYKKLNAVMKDLAGSTLKDLKKALQEGKRELDKMSERDPKRKQLVDDLQKIQQQIAKLTGTTTTFGKTHSGVWSTAVKNITAYVGVFGMFNFVKNKITEVIRGGAELSDQMAQVRMVSGLAMQDIEDLTRTLAKMDTRTTLSELERIAYAGAKLGFGEYGTKGLEEFVRAANQVNVALREDLGEEALTALSKITENMGLIKKMGVEDAMLATSSAMFKLAATSTAAAGPIVEVTKRLVPVAQASGMATHEILALASASDSLQLMPEVVGTALSKLLMAMQNNHNLIENALDIPDGTIAKMIKAGDVMDAMLMIFDKMSGKNMTELSGIWKLLGSDGQRLITVVQAMANHTDTLRKHLETSTQAFKEATAVTEEYNIQQETAAALFQRASNLWRNAMVNADTSLSVKEMAKSWYDFSKSVLSSEFSLSAIKTTIDALLLTFRLLINLLPMITFGLIAKGAAMLAERLMSAKLAADGFTLSWKKMDAATKSNWIGLAIGLFAQLAFSVAQWAKSNEEAAASQKKLNLAIDSATEKAEEEIGKMSRLKSMTEDTTLATEERQKMFSKFKSDYDIYLNYLGLELKSVDELAKHYDALTKVMRQRFAYQEREDYKREVMGGEEGLRMQRRNAGADLKRMGSEIGQEVDLAIVDELVRGGAKTAGEVFVKLFPNIEKIISDRQKTGLSGGRYGDFAKQFAKYFGRVRVEDETSQKIDEAFAQEIGDFDYDKWLRSQVKGDFNLKPDKEALKALRKEQQEAKEAMRKEMQDAQKESTGVLSKLEEWYRLQEAAITEARADGKMTEEQAAQMVNTLNIIKNESLATARRAITTGDTAAWDKLKTEVMPKAMADASDLSQNLLETIQNVPVQVLHDNLAKFNGDAEKVFGLDSRAFFDQINAKAAGNTREAARLRAKLFKQAEKLLEQYEIVRVAQKKMQTDLEGIGLYTETYKEFAQRMQQGITEQPPKTLKNGKTITAEEAYAQMGAKFIGQGTIPYRINIENADEALQWLHDFATNAKGELEDWAQVFPDIEKWVKELNDLQQKRNELIQSGKELTQEELEELSKIPDTLKEAIPTIRAMFYQLEQSASSVADNIKQQVDKMYDRKPIGLGEMEEQHQGRKAKMRSLWQEEIDTAEAGGGDATDIKKQRDQQLLDLEHQYQQELWGIREQYGLNVFQQYQKELEALNYMHEKGLISEKKYQIEKAKLMIKLGKGVYDTYGGMMSDMVNALQESEIAAVEAKYDAEINAAKANGEDTTALEEQKEAEIMEIRKKYAGMQFAMKISEIIANTAVAIMQAYAQLGPIGGSIAAAMLTATGAAQLALAKAEYDKVMGMQTGGSKASTSTASNTKTKLASGMLTYDKGNVKRFVGQDGKVYTATEEPAPKDGLVTHPIATTVQGQPALVAENGPEIVVGRETTKAIMMNEPELIRYLANYQQHGGSQGYSTARGLAAYDSGNVQSAAGTQPSNISPQTSDAAAEREALRQRLDRSDELMAQVLYYLQNPIPPEIAMYDNGGKKGLHSKIKEANSFMARYGG